MFCRSSRPKVDATFPPKLRPDLPAGSSWRWPSTAPRPSFRGHDPARTAGAGVGDLHPARDIVAAIDDDPKIIAMWQEVGIAVAMVLEGGGVLPLRCAR